MDAPLDDGEWHAHRALSAIEWHAVEPRKLGARAPVSQK